MNISIGQVFDSLTVIEKVQNYDKNDTKENYMVRCECGKEREIAGKNLRRGCIRACFTCRPKIAAKPHDGKKAYWGDNSKLFTENKS